MRSPLDPEVALDLLLSAICSRNQYTRDPDPIVAELTAAAGGRDDVLARVAGLWAGYFDSAEIAVLAGALRDLPGVDARVAEGQRRRSIQRHGAPVRGRLQAWPP